MNSPPVSPKCKAFFSSRCIALVCLFAIFLFTQSTYAASEEKKGGADSALQAQQAPAQKSASLSFYDLQSPCLGDCLVTAAFGRYVKTSIAASTGVSYASDSNPEEEERARSDASFLH